MFREQWPTGYDQRQWEIEILVSLSVAEEHLKPEMEVVYDARNHRDGEGDIALRDDRAA